MSSKTSLGSVGMGSGLGDQDITGAQQSRLQPECGSPPGEGIYDCIAFVIYCSQHQRVALNVCESAVNKVVAKAVWFPFVVLASSKTWSIGAEEGIRLILNKEDQELDPKMSHGLKLPIRERRRLHLFHIQIPGNRKFTTRLTQFVRIESLDKNVDFKCCENTKRIHWFPIDDVLNGKVGQLWGPEVQMFTDLCRKPKSIGITEYSLEKAFSLLETEDQLLKSLKINEKHIEVLFSDFLEHCFPTLHMTCHSFKDYLCKYGYEPNDNRFTLLFNAFDFERKGYIDFTQLLLGLASIDPSTDHKKARVQFVFRYYDIDCDKYLNEKEFKQMVRDMNPNDSTNELQSKLKNGMSAIGADNQKISEDAFVKAVGALKFRGTSTLCRSPHQILPQISKSVSNRSDLRIRVFTHKHSEGKHKRKNKGLCLKCKTKKYEYALHSVDMATSGLCVNALRMDDDPSFDPSNENNISNALKTYSIEFVFNTRGIASAFMDLIEEFNQTKGKTKKDLGFQAEPSDRFSFHKHLQRFCSDLEVVFKSEERIIRVNGPVVVLGDICGNLDLLLTIKLILFNSFPLISANYVFLGNYVLTGKWGIECLLYLLSLKLMAPNKVFLLRGRHEVNGNGIENTFKTELVFKYGDNYGLKLWEMFNKLFDSMPFAVIVDETILCVNSGIPNIKTKVLDLNKNSTQLSNPTSDPSNLWQFIFNQMTYETIATKNGFKPNPKQGLGYLFNEVAINQFLDFNSLTHIICGTRPAPNACQFHFDCKFITIFSSNIDNNSGSTALLLSNNKIRVLRLETTSETTLTSETNKNIN